MQGPLCARRDRGPAPQPRFLCIVCSPLGPSGGSQSHVLFGPLAALEATPWKAVPLTGRQTEARNPGARVGRSKCRFRWLRWHR